MKYAEKTSVSSERSRNEIERTLSKCGATSFAYGWQGECAIIGFQMTGRMIRFSLPLPAKDAKEFQRDGRGSIRSPEKREEVWEQACRQKWRALALAVKAKLEAVSSHITTFEEEFMAHIVLPGGQTVGKWMAPQIANAYENKRMPQLLDFKP